MSKSFSRSDVEGLLEELGRRLERRGLVANVYLVGGAAMSLVYDRGRITNDIDAIYTNIDAVEKTAHEMARELGLAHDWINSSVRQFLPTNEEISSTVKFDHGGLRVSVASPRHLLAMKMAAFRPQDQNDLVALFDELNITDPADAVDITFDAYGDDYLVLAGGSGRREEYLLRAKSIMERRQRRITPTLARSGSSCRICGRPLRSPASIARGMGPGCSKK